MLRGQLPGFVLWGCHGDDEQAVYVELYEIVEETIELYETEGKALPSVES